VQNGDEEGIDCGGSCPAVCDPFVEHFTDATRLASMNQAALSAPSHIVPTGLETGLETVPDSDTRLLMHFNRDTSVGEDDFSVHDWSENGNDALMFGAVYGFLHPIPNHDLYLIFNDPADRVTVPDFQNSIDPSAGLTVAIWARNHNSSLNEWSYIWSFSSSKNLRFDGGQDLRLCVISSYCRTFSDVIPDHEWHHIVVTVEGTEWKVYVDAVHVGTVDGGIGLLDFPAEYDVWLGGAYQSGIETSSDEFTIWNATLSESQIADLFAGRRMVGDFQSVDLATSSPIYYLTANWNQTGFEASAQVSGDQGNTWCDIDNGGTVHYFDCGLPSYEFTYRMEFVGDASIDDVTFNWSSVPAPCPDADGDGYDDWDGVYPHCTDDGLPQDCDDQNPHLHPDSANPRCNCDDADGYSPASYESYPAGMCQDQIENDCDGLVDYDDPDCAEDPASWEDLDLRFTGIDVHLQGSKHHDYAVERLWHDNLSDDDIVVFMKSDAVTIKLGHNEHNLKGGGLLATTASLKNRDHEEGLQIPERIRVTLKDHVREQKENQFDFNIEVVEHPDSFDLIVDDLDVPGVEERFDGVTYASLDAVSSAYVDLLYTGEEAPILPIDLPRQQEQRIHPGYIIYRIDGDELRDDDRYEYTSRNVVDGVCTPDPAFEDQFSDPEILFFRYDQPFTMAPFKGIVGNNGQPLYDDARIHYGMLDSVGDEWHTLTFWDDDPHTNCDVDGRDDGSSDGKIIHLVLDPTTPAISLRAPAGEEYYTTPPKTYYTPHVFDQTTYLTAGVEIALHNVTNADDVYYRVDGGPWTLYEGVLTAAALFGVDDTLYDFSYRIGVAGPVRVRRVHYNPAQPAQQEVHPKLRFDGASALELERWLVYGGDAERTERYRSYLENTVRQYAVDFRQGTRSLGYTDTIRYFYQLKDLSEVVEDLAYYGAVERSDEFYRPAKEALLFLYTVDPIGCENNKGRSGGPSQERCMYSDGRVVPSIPLAYDLLHSYTMENGYESGMTPIEHIKIRDNLAGEAAILLKYPHSDPGDFWSTERFSDNSIRNLELETTYTGIAMAMPSYDSHHYGTSGADRVTTATHLHAPFPDAAVEWSKLHFEGFVQHPTRPDLFRDSFLYGLFDSDGAYVGETRENYITSMHHDLIPFIVARENFDQHHYARIEDNLRQEILSSRNPVTGEKLMDSYAADPRRAGVPSYTLPLLINESFQYAPEYRWAKENPTVIDSSLDYMMDSSIGLEPPPVNSIVSDNYATFSGDLTDPDTIFMRMKILATEVPHGGGSALRYFGGGFNIIGFGERLAIDLTSGYGNVDWGELVRASRQNVILIDGMDDPNYLQVRGSMEDAFLSDHLDYACMRTDLAMTPEESSFKIADVNQARHVFFPDKRFFVVVDEMRSGSGSHDYDFVLHGTTGGNSQPWAFRKELSYDRVTWTKTSGVRLLTQFVSDVELDAADLRAVDYFENPEEPFFEEPYIKARMSGTDVDFVTVLYPLANLESEPRMNVLNWPGYDAVKIPTETGTVVVIKNRSGGEVEFVGVRTDGEIALVKLDQIDRFEYFALIGGRTLSYLGDDLADHAEQGDYFGEAERVDVPALGGWGLAILVLALLATAVPSVRARRAPRWTGRAH
jgi:hypothetical protein